MSKNNDFPNGQKRGLTYFRAMFVYVFAASVLIFLASVGVAQKLLFWNQSVFVSTILMFAVMIFYFRTTLKRAELVSREKDTFDFIRKHLAKTGEGPSPKHQELVFDTDAFLRNCSSEESSKTFVADYFRDMGKRIKTVRNLTGLVGNAELINTDDLKFCFYADMERLIKPTVNAGRKLLLFGFLGTVAGILLIGVGMQFGETVQQTLLIAKELIAGLGVAALTTILGIVGNLMISSFYEQQEDIRDRLLAELTRITNIYGLDLRAPPETESEAPDG